MNNVYSELAMTVKIQKLARERLREFKTMKSKEYKLSVDMIPKSSWGKSLAQLLARPAWDVIRRDVYRQGDWVCMICNSINTRLHAHEVWDFNDKKNVQKLKGFQCLCEDCHNIKHWGRTIAECHKGNYTQKYVEELRQHFCRVNNCTVNDMHYHIAEKTKIWMARNTHEYRIDWGIYRPDRVVKLLAEVDQKNAKSKK